MMSLRRLAVIAPLTLMHNKHNNNTANVVNMTTSTTTTAATATTNVDVKQTQIVGAAAKTTTTTTTDNNKHNNNKHAIIDDDSYTDDSAATDSSSNDDSNETYTNLMTNTYADGGGSGMQTIRASFGISGLIGHSPGGISSGGNIGGGHQTYPHTINGNANLLLCGAMLSVVTTILCVVCYCCHRNIKKRTEAAYRQQHQWLESDPNMEIYSVEQSYETSGLFLGESSDGFTTLATLHHEPPPSYDAVVAMQEQQLLQHQLYQQQCHLQQQQQQHQQQMHLQHSSPPPGYRSTLTVNDMPTPTMSASAATSNMAMDTLTNDSNGNLSGSCNISISGNSIGGNSCSNFFACGKPNTSNNRYSNNNSNTVAFYNMKKALNAQSCCSLQRAEVENMWNAAAAAVAVRASHATSSPCGAASLAVGNAAAGSSNGTNNNNSSRSHISPMLLARKSLPLPLTLPAKFTAKSGARRYLSHHSTYYRRGCPLCGKFRYDVDDALTQSVESGLDVPASTSTSTGAAAVTAGRAVAPVAAGANVGEVSSSADLRVSDSCQQLTALDDVVSEGRMTAEALSHRQLDKCACVVNILESPTTVIIDNDSNGNNNNNSLAAINAANNLNAQSSELCNDTAVESTAEMIDQNANANGKAVIERESLEEAESIELTENANLDVVASTNAASSSNFDTEAAASMVSVEAPSPNSSEDNTLDVLNANSGIIRVDMSKIIDQTGLPTYAAAAKLESSGYV
ncbi:uncharacterized protein LOC114804749 [Zeugodacus cucurbitae]|uniref:uncharacterized protein LOC114804749 n=1 Tax=Zeugodacus cucurbitae TaxID=28588 RepID=UPI0023D8E3DA|nr:uncharacterized protein LOC114804749 [Zeugodacus cucurbitae]XP_054090881.1 uncharacterized protein LOC114804749 [Zeugodacus cucurbitae]